MSVHTTKCKIGLSPCANDIANKYWEPTKHKKLIKKTEQDGYVSPLSKLDHTDIRIIKSLHDWFDMSASEVNKLMPDVNRSVISNIIDGVNHSKVPTSSSLDDARRLCKHYLALMEGSK